MTDRKGFTLIELLVVIAIIGILAAVVVIAINPLEFIRRGRDSRRMSELNSLRSAINAASVEDVQLASTGGSAVSSTTGTRASNGTGWLPMDLSQHLSVLPIDPLNGQTGPDVRGNNVTWEYQFAADGTYYILRSRLEAQRNTTAYDDDGNANQWYELGTAPGLSGYFGL